MISSRVTQVYDEGACVYFYLAINGTDVPNAAHHLEETENAARDEIMACGGSISHHHGVGKVRQRWFADQVSDLGVEMYKSIKHHVDPNNIFAAGNLCSWQTSERE
jgi:alkyldihydroxyacetonephosphate synthase